MSEKRCFSNCIIDSDLFLDMPAKAQLLYFHLGMHTDNEGFVSSPRKIQRIVGCCDEDMDILVSNGYVIPFESGVIVITHFNVHNSLRKDRQKTVYKHERALLSLDETGAYTLGGQLSDNCQTSDSQVTNNCPPKRREEKGREYNRREGNCTAAEAAALTPSKSVLKNTYGEYNNVLLSDPELDKLKEDYPKLYEKYIERLSSYIEQTGKAYKSHYATIKTWIRRDNEREQNKNENTSPDYSQDILEVI